MQPLCGVLQGGLAQIKPLEVLVVSLEAGVTGLTAAVIATIAPLALVTAGSREARLAQAAPCHLVTARPLSALEVAVTSCGEQGGEGKRSGLGRNFLCR